MVEEKEKEKDTWNRVAGAGAGESGGRPISFFLDFFSRRDGGDRGEGKGRRVDGNRK